MAPNLLYPPETYTFDLKSKGHVGRDSRKPVLSRTARSCRATTHYDLATLKECQVGPYYCFKHYKICTPIESILKHLKHYTEDTIQRLTEFETLKKQVNIEIIHGDSRQVDIFDQIEKQNTKFFNLLKKKKIAGIFSSPPYVGQIDYHEQHAYAYELFNIARRDDDEIGPMSKGTGKTAKELYVQGISEVLINVGNYIKKDGHFFIVANDKHNLYPLIAEKSGLKITPSSWPWSTTPRRRCPSPSVSWNTSTTTILRLCGGIRTSPRS